MGPWPCKLIEVEERPILCQCGLPECPHYLYLERVDKATGKPPVVGDMWFGEDELMSPSYLSPQYWARHAATRKPLWCVMPGGRPFCLDTVYVNNGLLGTDGWTVSGDAPRMTLVPSINLVGTYHGYLTDGVISKDLDGHVYSDNGMRQLRP